MNELMCNYQVESNDFRELLESELVYIGTFGLKDPIRDDIFETVNKIKHGRATPIEDGKAA